MAKISGLGTTVAVDLADGTTVTDISNDVTNISFSTPRGEQDVTGLDKSAMERLLLLADGKVTISGVYNAALSHTVFKTVPSNSTARTTTITLPGGAVLAMEILYSDYAVTRAANGSLTWTATGSLASGTVPLWA